MPTASVFSRKSLTQRLTWTGQAKAHAAQLKCPTLCIDDKGTFFNGRQISSVTMQQLNIPSHPYISLKIGVKKDAKNVGGIKLFGEKMGDYPQDIIVKLRS